MPGLLHYSFTFDFNCGVAATFTLTMLPLQADPNVLLAPLSENPIVLAVLAAVIYAGTGYSKNAARARGDVPFDPVEFGATLLVGAIVGVVLGLSGLHPTEAIITEQLAAYAGIVSIVTMALKGAVGAVKTTDSGRRSDEDEPPVP